MGAGLIPFALHEEELYFLFQTVFEGRKTGFLNDFGGGLSQGEDYRQTAIREFVEETETMYFAEDICNAARTSENIQAQIPILEQLFDATLKQHPDWWCPRRSFNRFRPKDWRSYFVRFPYRDPSAMNRAWEEDSIGRFKKRRELIWVSAPKLLDFYRNQPERLWRRVRHLDGAPDTIRAIQGVMCPQGTESF